MKEKAVSMFAAGGMAALVAVGLIGGLLLIVGGPTGLLEQMLSLWLPISIIASVAGIVRMCLPTEHWAATVVTGLIAASGGAVGFVWLMLKALPRC